MNAARATTTRLTADERRDSVVAAAATEFAAGGYSGTSTESIARRAGVSQPYLFQLFGSKRELFVATIRMCFTRTRDQFEEAARKARKDTTDPKQILLAMGNAYARMLRDRELLRLQLQCYAACDDPVIGQVVGEEWGNLYNAVSRASGAPNEALHAWFAEGMLMNVVAMLGDAAPPGMKTVPGLTERL